MAYPVFSPFLGALSDRVGGRFVIALFCGVMGPLTALIFYGIVGAGSGTFWAPVLSVTQRWFKRGQRGIITGVVDSGSSTAWILTGVTVPVVVALLDWRGAWLVLGAMGISIAVSNALLLRDRPYQFPVDEAHPASTSKTSSPLARTDILNTPFFWLAGLCIPYSRIGIPAW